MENFGEQATGSADVEGTRGVGGEAEGAGY